MTHRDTLAVLATCFNRRETTLRGLATLREATAGLHYQVWLVDDGSTDGTGAAVLAAFPEVTVIQGDGSLYWNGGMRRAWQTSLNDGGADYYLLYNDDLEMAPDSLAQLLAFQKEKEAEHGPKVISIGKVIDPSGGAVTYGGYVVGPGLSRLRFVRVPDHDQPCDTMNGNCTLIPACAIEEIGVLSDRYRHHSGDIDYGLRARDAGYKLFQSREPVGRTPFNHVAHAQQDLLTWTTRKFVLTHPKGLPIREWLHFCRTHGGWLWPANFLLRYLKIIRLRG